MNSQNYSPQVHSYEAQRQRNRTLALEGQSALAYAVNTDFLGLPVEDEQLYDQGRAEIEFQEKQRTAIKYSGFIRGSQGINTGKLEADNNRKRDVLAKYFPKFGIRGKQDMCFHSPSEVGVIFNRVLANSKKQLKLVKWTISV